MQIVFQGDNLHEMSKAYFPGKLFQNAACWIFSQYTKY